MRPPDPQPPGPLPDGAGLKASTPAARASQYSRRRKPAGPRPSQKGQPCCGPRPSATLRQGALTLACGVTRCPGGGWSLVPPGACFCGGVSRVAFVFVLFGLVVGAWFLWAPVLVSRCLAARSRSRGLCPAGPLACGLLGVVAGAPLVVVRPPVPLPPSLPLLVPGLAVPPLVLPAGRRVVCRGGAPLAGVVPAPLGARPGAARPGALVVSPLAGRSFRPSPCAARSSGRCLIYKA